MNHVNVRAVVAAAFATVVFVAALRTHSNDFWAYYWAAAHAGSEPHAVYAAVPREAFGKDVPPFVYAPTAILLFIPLVQLPPLAAAWVWFGISVVAAAVVSFILVPRILSKGNTPPGLGAALVTSTFFNYPFYATLLAGQVNVVIALLLLAFHVLAVPGSDPRTARARGTGVRPRYMNAQRIASGFCLAAAIAVKLYPAIFLLLLARKRRFHDVLIAAAFLAAFVAATLLVFPHVLWREWSTLVISAGGFGRSLPALTYDLAAYNISLNGTLMRLLGPGPLAGRLAIAAGTLMLVWSLVRSSGVSRPDVAETTTIALVMICAAPIAWAHHLALVIPLAAVSMRAVTPSSLAVAAYAAICFKWDWSFGSVMLGAVAPATAAIIALWTQTLPPRQAAVTASAETA